MTCMRCSKFMIVLDLLYWPFWTFWTLGLEAYLFWSAWNSCTSRFRLALWKKQQQNYGFWYLLVSCRAQMPNVQCTILHNAHRSTSQQGGCQRGDLDGGGPGSQLSAPPPPWLYIRVLSANVHFSVNPIVLVDALDTTSSMSSTSNLPTSPDLTATSTSGITSFSTLTGLQWLAPLPSYYGLCPFFSSLFLLRFEGKITRINISKKILMGRKTRSGPDSGNLRKVLEPTFS